MQINQDILDQPLYENVSFTNSSSLNNQINLNQDNSIFYKGLFALILNILPGTIIGLILVKMTLDQAKIALKDFKNNPSHYKSHSIKKVKNGQLMAYIGLSFVILEILGLLIYTSL